MWSKLMPSSVCPYEHVCYRYMEREIPSSKGGSFPREFEENAALIEPHVTGEGPRRWDGGGVKEEPPGKVLPA